MNFKVKNVDNEQVRNKYAKMIQEGKASVVKGIAMGASGTRQQIAKQVCQQHGIDLTKKTKTVDYSKHADAVLVNIVNMPHVSDEKKQAAQAELEKRHVASKDQ